MANLQLQQLGQVAQKQTQEIVKIGMDTVAGFEAMQRIAKMYSTSQIVPKIYQGTENIGNCVIAIDMANRLKMHPLMVMQNLYIVYGQPSWSSKFLIATFNQCGRFSSIQYEMIGEKNTDTWGCVAFAMEKETGNIIKSAEVTIGIAKKEGWFSKNGSKWQTMPELMLQYRAASLLIRTHAPEISMGLSTEEEVFDMQQDERGNYIVTDLENAYIPPAKPVETAPDKKELTAEAETVSEKPKKERSKKETPAETPAEEKSPFRQYMDSMSPEERLAEEQKIKTEKEHRREEKIIQSNFVDDDSFYTNGK